MKDSPHKTDKNLVALGDEERYLDDGEQLGFFNPIAVEKLQSLSKQLTRLPIFLPGPSKRQIVMLDQDYALILDIPFVRCRRFGATT
jgi:hypothetical protein